ncbi:MAG: hypothetical protein HYU67_02730 [Flavobacteriia bacterium]|nr:hypothetical protein [Flavobacteriia bacterium]
MKKKIVNIEGYWLKKNFNELPAISGIFFIYECKHVIKNDIIVLKKIIYIGESDNIKEDIKNERKLDVLFKNFSSREIAVSYAGILDKNERKLIFENYKFYLNLQQNDNSINSLDFNPITLISIGNIEFIEPFYTLNYNISFKSNRTISKVLI